jgi:Ca2+-binding RTX toxin-like protein
MLTVGTMLLAFASGIALAKAISCTGGLCEGTNKADTISGSKKNDTIIARKGNDVVYAGQGGRDTVKGGAGIDLIYVGETVLSSPDTVQCGTGQDTVFANKEDKVAKDCEVVSKF